MKVSLVVGLGFGDEGKGRTVSALAYQTLRPIVVRFNGGHQAGHTANAGQVRHVFSSFGSGTLKGAPTIWSRYCTFYPTGVRNEYETLVKECHEAKVVPLTPELYVDPLSPVTTPYDISVNHHMEQNNGHGTVGVGFGQTIARQEAHYTLYFQDLFNDTVFRAKLNNIDKYYREMQHITKAGWPWKKDEFLKDVQWIRQQWWIKHLTDVKLNDFDHIIFEGAQGILLDMDFGFFPNVTRSNTTSKNALTLYKEMCVKNLVDCPSPDVYYVTRCYQTRHGEGFMSDQDLLILKNNENETNVRQTWQGEFRTGELDPNLIRYALECDNHFSKDLKKHLAITCLDQRDFDYKKLLRELAAWKFESVLLSKSDSGVLEKG